MNVFSNPERISENYGIKIGAGLIAYFGIMYLIGLGNHVELRLLNLVILAAGVYYGLKKFKETHGKHINYFRALATGVSISTIGSFIFATFLFVFMKSNDGFMTWIIENEKMGRYLNPYMGSFIVLLEGVFSGLLVTFVLLNWIDTDEVTE
ncbi:MAG: DUF4199 domain-containing protein [Cyclobacteriaceae bacterium]